MKQGSKGDTCHDCGWRLLGDPGHLVNRRRLCDACAAHVTQRGVVSPGTPRWRSDPSGFDSLVKQGVSVLHHRQTTRGVVDLLVSTQHLHVVTRSDAGPSAQLVGGVVHTVTGAAGSLHEAALEAARAVADVTQRLTDPPRITPVLHLQGSDQPPRDVAGLVVVGSRHAKDLHVTGSDGDLLRRTMRLFPPSGPGKVRRFTGRMRG